MKAKRALKRELLVLALLVGLVLVVGIINPSFLRSATITGILNSSLILVLVAIGEMFVVVTRGIDVSVGATMGLSAVILGLALNAGIPLPISAFLAILTGATAGAINGIGVTRFGVPPIIMTLGAMGVSRGFMRVLTDGSWIETIPQPIKTLSQAQFLGVGFFVWMTVVIIIATTLIVHRWRPARHLYAVGDNDEGAFLLGVRVRLARFTAFVLAGLFAGIASIIFVSQIGFVPMQTGSGLEMRAIAASVLGGVNLSGGVGNPISSVVGALFLTTIDSVLVFLRVPAEWNNAIAGGILIAVVLLDYRTRTVIAVRQRKAQAAVRREMSIAISDRGVV